MSQLIECVPNVSEGRRTEVITMLWEAMAAERGITLLDRTSDLSHNRTVFTLVGNAKALRGAILRLYEAAIAHIDLREHKGEHPRMGAVDVVPFVPVRDCDLACCVELAKAVGAEVAKLFGIPVFLYAAAARVAERRVLANIRKGEFEGLVEKLAETQWHPDFGPSVPHPAAGATAIGARPFLIAYNLQLGTKDLKIAQNIAKAVRASSGGLQNVQALGVYLAERQVAQVSMNLLDFEKTSLYRVQELVKAEAKRYGVAVTDSEIVGLIPQAALNEAAAAYLQVGNWSIDLVLEERIRQQQEVGCDFSELPIPDFLGKVAASSAVPGGGSVAALAGALASALVAMVGRLTKGPNYEQVKATADQLVTAGEAAVTEALQAVNSDAAAFQAVIAALALPKETAEEKQQRRDQIQEATKLAAKVPLQVAEQAVAVADLALLALERGNQQAASDAGVAVLLALGSLEGALLNVAINLDAIKDASWVSEQRAIAIELLIKAKSLRERLWEVLSDKIPEVALQNRLLKDSKGRPAQAMR
ncbi:MAG: glutamate formimidoyltransferase [Cyanobacteria bacterium NC_groundwater_1444_Ag_S-0.65um_54_12]|nr:glutamate formimidoyltransferase [Cyanobacteria bacterium NC_groundwater_1444_Ag_S-0.65um_54_12]